MTDLKLIYIIGLGENWEGERTYQFLFTKGDQLSVIEDLSDGWGWSNYPATGTPEKPETEYVYGVGTINTDKPFELIQDSDTFSVWDAMDGVTSLAWEDLTEYDEYPEFRLFFRYGETVEEIKKKLLRVDINLEYNEVKKEF